MLHAKKTTFGTIKTIINEITKLATVTSQSTIFVINFVTRAASTTSIKY